MKKTGDIKDITELLEWGRANSFALHQVTIGNVSVTATDVKPVESKANKSGLPANEKDLYDNFASQYGIERGDGDE